MVTKVDWIRERAQHPNLPYIVEKPWGHEVILEWNDFYMLKKVVIRPNQRLSLQYHEVKHETMFVLSGSGKILLGNGVKPAEPGKVFAIPPGHLHRLMAGADALVVLETSTTEIDDVIRLEDEYGR